MRKKTLYLVVVVMVLFSLTGCIPEVVQEGDEIIFKGSFNLESEEMLAMVENCTRITGNVSIYGLSITQIPKLKSLKAIDGNLTISRNVKLQDLSGLNNLTHIGGELVVATNANLATVDLPNLESIGSHLNILNNPKVQNLSGLKQLKTIKGQININSMNKLSNIDGLARITEIGQALDIVSNKKLENLNGLKNLRRINVIDEPATENCKTQLHISNNSTLPEHLAQEVLDQLTPAPDCSYIR